VFRKSAAVVIGRAEEKDLLHGPHYPPSVGIWVERHRCPTGRGIAGLEAMEVTKLRPLGMGNATPLALVSVHRLQSIAMRSPGRIDASISEGISRFEQDYTGRGSKDTPHRKEER
jgi:hypothetical protein